MLRGSCYWIVGIASAAREIAIARNEPLTATQFANLTRGGCIDRTEFGRGETGFGLFHRRAESPMANMLRLHRPEQFNAGCNSIQMDIPNRSP